MDNRLEKNYNWDATSFFRDLTARNKLAQEQGYLFASVSGLEGLEEYIATMQSSRAAVCVSDISPGYTEMTLTPRTRRVKTVFMMKRHAINDMAARQRCMDEMRELFRQFMSAIFKERTRINEGIIYLDTRVQFQEIERYFAAGAACAYFQISIDTQTNLVYRDEEWLE
jgi:hypothetical protein